MAIGDLSRLIPVPLRNAWEHEALDFTPWLADHLDDLSEALGLELETVEYEAAVGAFSADILAIDASSGRKVLIENQLETTDHGHLGQILTYLAGLEAEIVVWVAARFRDEHLSAVEWLNSHTQDPYSFFAVRVSAVRIADSPIAPQFTVEAQPNEWERSLSRLSKAAESHASQRSADRRRFWAHFVDQYPSLAGDKPASAGSSRWYDTSNPDSVVSLFIADDGVGCFLRGQRGESESERQERLAPYLEDLETAIGSLGERNEPLSRMARIDYRAEPERATQWLHDRLEGFRDAVALTLPAQGE